MSDNAKLKKSNSLFIGTIFALTLLIPQNVGINFFGINFEDIPLIFIFFYLIFYKIKNFKNKKYDKYSLCFILFFVIYTNILVDDIKIFNHTNLRFYFYFTLAYLAVDYLRKNKDNIVNLFEPLSIVMICNFFIIIFQVQLPGTTDGWISSNTSSLNLFTSGRLGGFQGGGPNVIGIFCAIYALLCFYKALSSESFKKYILDMKTNTFLLIISLVNLLFTFSRGSYLAFAVGLFLLICFTDKYSNKVKYKIFTSISVISLIIIYSFPSVFLKESNRSFLYNLGIQNVEVFRGVGGGNYIKNVYKDYLITLDNESLLERFNIIYSDKERDIDSSNNEKALSSPVEGYLRLKFDYRDSFLPRSVISFFYSNDGANWSQIGYEHTNGTIIDLIENDSYFEVGGWGDGQSPGGQQLSGYLKKVTIKTDEYERHFLFSKENRDKDYFLLTPILRNEYEKNIDYKNNSVLLKRPRDYWVALPNEINLSKKDFEISLHLDLDSIPGGHETIFSQSSILRLNQEFNDQSWRWSIIDGRMYFFWVDEVIYGYSKFVGGQSMRSGKLISKNGNFDSIISNFSLSQYDEITTSHNGFLTMAVEYGLFLILLIVILLIYLISKHFNKSYDLEVALIFMLLTQNFTNDLVYAPDVAIYFWILPFYFLSNIAAD